MLNHNTFSSSKKKQMRMIGRRKVTTSAGLLLAIALPDVTVVEDWLLVSGVVILGAVVVVTRL